MTSKPMRIALAQLNPTSGDIAGNTGRVLEALEEARRRGADLFVAPEMVVPGYCIGDLIEHVDFLAANEQAMQRIAAAARGITAVIGFIDYDPAARNDHGAIRKYNAAATVRDGRVLQRARKSLLPNYRYFDDKRWFAPGDRRDFGDSRAGGVFEHRCRLRRHQDDLVGRRAPGVRDLGAIAGAVRSLGR